MGSRRLDQVLARHSRISVDAAPLIYFLGEVEPWGPVIRDAVMTASSSGKELVVSAVTEAELLVGPLKARDKVSADAISRLLQVRGVTVATVTREVARSAAEMRARYGLDLADAVVAATATVAGCTVLVGNDLSFRRVKATWSYIHLDDYV